MEPRLGKTKVALDWVGMLALKGELQRVVVFAPSIALDVWRTQLRLHYPLSYTVEDFDFEYPVVARNDNRMRTAFFLAGREETFRATRPHVNLERPKQNIIEQWSPDAVIIDESHEYKRPGGRAAQDAWRLVRRLRKRAGGGGRPYVLLLSGTPDPKGWRDLFAQFRIMDESLLGTNAGSFDEEYVIRGVGRRKWTIIRYQNLQRLQRIVDRNSATCTARQAGLEGKLFWQVLPVKLPQKARELYDELAENYIVETDRGTIDAANQGVLRLRLVQLTSGFTTDGGEIHSAKVQRFKLYTEQLCDQGESVVVCCRFTAEIDCYRGILQQVGYHTRVLDGRTRRRDRGDVVEAFQSGEGIQALVVQHQAGSLAIELTRAAEVVFPTLPDGWVQFWQCLNRLRGPNQPRPVRVTALVAGGTVDRGILAGLRRKGDWHADLMKDPYNFLKGQTAV
jgi:SNF2 family DNA or RNA helicase